MYQINVLEKDRDALHFLWRDKPTDKICDYITNVHRFGTVDSPCCASWSLKKTATNEANNYCNSSIDKVLYNFYMDDYLDSFTNRINATKTIHDVINILNNRGFFYINGNLMIVKYFDHYQTVRYHRKL